MKTDPAACRQYLRPVFPISLDSAQNAYLANFMQKQQYSCQEWTEVSMCCHQMIDRTI